MNKQQCQEYKDYYDRRKERDCKIAQTNYDLGRKKALGEFEEVVGEREKILKPLIKKFDYDIDKHRLDELKQLRAKLNQLKE